MKRWKRTETVDDMWQWNGPEDNRGIVEHYQYGTGYHLTPIASPPGKKVWIHEGQWIIKRGYNYEVISDAEFKAQGWEEIDETK